MAGGATPVVTPEPSDEVTLDLDEVRVLLPQLGLDRRLITEQSAICVLALADGAERDGLLPGKKRLRDGARIHDIIEFARHECGKEVAENTRESYRKLSLQPLCEEGLVVRHQLSTNDPKTFYRLHPEMLRLLTCPGNSAGNPTLDLATHTDWRSPDEVSYSYQLPPAPGAPLVWSGRIRMIVLSDRSPVVERARAGESFDPMASSTMHKGRGQNVLVSDGSAHLLVSPELPNGDNIWLPRSQERLAHPSLRGMERPDGADDAFVGP
jgi:hypothetical protein